MIIIVQKNWIFQYVLIYSKIIKKNNIKKIEKKKKKIKLNLKSIKPKHLSNLNLNEFINSSNKKILSRNVNNFNSLSPITSKKISAFTLFSPIKNKNN